MFTNRLKEMILVVADHFNVQKDYVQVVWYSKTLRNAKMIFFIGTPNGTIYELTFNGENGEYYLDTYNKTKNEKID